MLVAVLNPPRTWPNGGLLVISLWFLVVSWWLLASLGGRDGRGRSSRRVVVMLHRCLGIYAGLLF